MVSQAKKNLRPMFVQSVAAQVYSRHGSNVDDRCIWSNAEQLYVVSAGYAALYDRLDTRRKEMRFLSDVRKAIVLLARSDSNSVHYVQLSNGLVV